MSILIKGMSMPKSCIECPFMALANTTDGRLLEFCNVSEMFVVGIETQKDPKCPLAKLPTIEELMEPMCDQCQWPGWYKDPDDMQREKCSRCPVEAKLMEALYDDA